MRRLVFALLLASVVFAARTDPKQVGSSQLSFKIEWILEGEPPFTLKTFGFDEYPYQIISFSSPDGFTEDSDEYGNSRLTFSVDGVTKKRITLTGTAAINYANGLEPASDFEVFLDESEFVEITPEIAVKARQITVGAANDYHEMVLLTEWVYNNVVYDESYGEQQFNSSQVFRELRGTCDEQSHLLIAFARSLGIPSRFSAGFVHSGDAWGPHAWVEFVYGGEWVPADPTFNELGLLDGTHLKFAHGRDQKDIAQEISEGVGVETLAPSIELDSSQPFSLLYNHSFYSLPENVGAGSLADARILIKSYSSEPQAVPLSIIVPTDPPELSVKLVGDKERLIYLAPDDEAVVEWRLVFPYAMREGYSYNFSIRVTSLGRSINSVIEGKKGGEVDEVSSARINELNAAFEGDAVTITAEVVNAGNTVYSATATCTFEGVEQSKRVSIPIGGSTLIQFVFPKPDKDFLTGELVLSNPQQTLRQPFELTIERVQPTPGTNPNNASLGIAAIGVLLIAAAFVILHRPRKPGIQAD